MLGDRRGAVVTVPVELARERPEPAAAEIVGLDRRVEVDPAEALSAPCELGVFVATRPLVIAADLVDRARPESAQVDRVDIARLSTFAPERRGAGPKTRGHRRHDAALACVMSLVAHLPADDGRSRAFEIG